MSRPVSGQARRAYEELRERWLGTPLPDGRVPGFVVSDEQDEELFAAWDEEEAFALSELRRIIGGLPKRPEPPLGDLAVAGSRLRELLGRPGCPANVLRACAGFDDRPMPDDDTELWLLVAAGIAGPVSDLSEEAGPLEEFADLEGRLSPEDTVMANLCAIQHAHWLAAVAALLRLGPGALASPERIARLIAESQDVDVYEQEPDDLGATEGLFLPVVGLWAVLGVVDGSEVLTPLGWWGLPEALERAWSPVD